jgi:TonB family protein
VASSAAPIRTPRPSYTVEALRQKITGEVILQVVIDTQGRVEVLRVLQSVPELDEEAVRVVENEWRFRPALKNNRPVPTLAELFVAFNLF